MHLIKHLYKHKPDRSTMPKIDFYKMIYHFIRIWRTHCWDLQLNDIQVTFYTYYIAERLLRVF